jgi:hypothetical protein
MDTTYDVRFWKTEVYESRNGSEYNTYYVRWTVAKKPFREPFATSTLAESFKSHLISAARRGEAFRKSTGRPLSWDRQERSEGWYTFACRYVDMKWKRAAATSRRSTAEANDDCHLRIAVNAARAPRCVRHEVSLARMGIQHATPQRQ